MAFGRERGATAARQVAGLVEILTFPFPIWRDSYQPLLPSDIPYIHGGYAEFPPEVGNESKYPYVRDTHQRFQLASALGEKPPWRRRQSDGS